MQLQNELNELKRMLLKMADIVQNNIKEAIEAYQLDKEVTINDRVVNQYELLVNEICVDILIKERPYARDLREVSAILKLVSDIERIGDHAEDIVRYASKLRGNTEKRPDRIDEMLEVTLEMLQKSILSFIQLDTDMAEEVIKMDDKIDEIYNEIIKSLTKRKNISEAALTFSIYTTIIVKYIERIADHVVNISEWVVFIVSGFYKDYLKSE
ncbi:MAG: phosphate signaling complex protein PhoU [Erysipelotrichales bacterium]|nr:phosphate signaling complex protein PhoU [Erysipelotrichales bacterium]